MSLREYDPDAHLWVLALDDFTHAYFQELGDPRIESIPLSELERADPELLATKANRTTVEYYFTLSPCWPRFLLQAHPEIARITYLDADMCWFSSPYPALAEMGNGSVLVTEHRHPAHLAHHVRYGRFNVGLLSFRNDAIGRACLDDWRERCLDWCHDVLEEDRYADQKYLDAWPARYGAAVRISQRRGVNLAPWNWSQYRYERSGDRLLVDGEPLELFHFARFRPSSGTWWFQSGQLEYGVMPWSLRQYLYGNYWRRLCLARERVRELRPGFDFASKSSRGWHQFWRAIAPRVLFGSDWLRVGPYFISGRLGLGRFSGMILSWTRSSLRQRLRRPLPAGSRPPLPVPPPDEMADAEIATARSADPSTVSR